MSFIEHGHCPNDCEHPQPFTLEDGKEYCGACYFHYNGQLSEMLPCTPDTCHELG